MKFQIHITSLRHVRPGPGTFRCDRSSPLGNRFHIPADGDRDAVCDKFAATFNPEDNPEQLVYLRRIWRYGAEHGSVKLACWCAPERCHCETIRSWLYSKMKG